MAGMYGCFRGRNSDNVAMASGVPDVTANQEPAEIQEECSGKKKSKFQTFKKFFARKKKKEPAAAAGSDAVLKASQSSDDVNKTSENNTLTRAEKEKGSGSKISLGSKALSHDSVFVSDSSEANEALGASQDSIHGKVKSLQLQLKQAIRLGSPPSLMCVKRTEDAGIMSEDDGLPCSPPEYTASNQAQRNSCIDLEGTDSEDEQLSCAGSSRAMSPLVVPGDFSQPASPFTCLDNSAAKHKLGLRHKACNKRKPARRSEGRSLLDDSVTQEDEALEELQTLKDVNTDQLEPKVGAKEQDEEEDKKEEKPQSSRRFLLSDKEEEEEEGEMGAEQEVPLSLDTSCPHDEEEEEEEEGGEEEEVSDLQPPHSSSFLDSPSATLEPPAGTPENFLTPTGEENTVGEEQEEEDGLRLKEEEESSFLLEVLSSLKTPLSSCSLDMETDNVVPEQKDDDEQKEENEVVENRAEEEIRKEGEEESLDYQRPSVQVLPDEITQEEEHEEGEEEEKEQEQVEEKGQKEEEEEVQEEEVEKEQEEEEEKEQEEEEDEVQEEEEEKEQEEEEEEEQEVATASKTTEKEVEEEEVSLAEEQTKSGEEETKEEQLTHHQEEEEEEEAEEEEEKAEEIKPDEKNITRQTVFQAEEEPIKLEESEEDEGGEVVVEEMNYEYQVTKTVPGEDDEDEEEDNRTKDADEIRVDLRGGDLENHSPLMSEGEEEEEEEEEISVIEIQPEQEETQQPAQAEEEEEDVKTMFDLDSDQVEPEREAPEEEDVLLKPSSLPLDQNDQPSSPSKTTTLQINLASPTSPTPAASPRVSEEEEERVSALDEEASSPPAAVEETSCSPDQSKVRFTIAPAWQRSHSLSPPPSPPPAAPSGEEEEEVVELMEEVLSPSRTSSTGPAAPEESSVVEEGNPDNPFGVRLRKTSGLLRFSSEEENVEPLAELPPLEPPHLVSVNPPTIQPIGSKPALPRKPDVHGDSLSKLKRVSDPAAGRSVSAVSDSPSWISMAKQKQKIYKENSLEEITVKKEDQERKSSLPTYVSSAASREHSIKTVSQLEIRKPSAEKDAKRSLSPPTPVPPQPVKPQLPPCPVAPKPNLPPATAPRTLPPPAPVPVPLKPPSCTSPPPLFKPASPVTSPPFSSRTPPEKPAVPSGQSASAHRGLPPAALPQDEPPWMALAKKKAKAWSEMPQIVQ